MLLNMRHILDNQSPKHRGLAGWLAGSRRATGLKEVWYTCLFLKSNLICIHSDCAGAFPPSHII